MLLRGIIVVRPIVAESERCKVAGDILFVGRAEGDCSLFVSHENLSFVSGERQLVRGDQRVKLIVDRIVADLFVGEVDSVVLSSAPQLGGEQY